MAADPRLVQHDGLDPDQRAVLEAGYTVVYDDKATVEHSHDYTPEEHHARGQIDAVPLSIFPPVFEQSGRGDADAVREFASPPRSLRTGGGSWRREDCAR